MENKSPSKDNKNERRRLSVSTTAHDDDKKTKTTQKHGN